MRGEASYFEDWPLELTRKGFPEQTWFTFSYSPIRDETGGIGGVLCTVHETTARVRAERERERLLTELAASETRLAAAVDLAGLFPYSWDPATGVLEWDARLKAMWGLPPDAHVDTDVWRAGVHPERRRVVIWWRRQRRRVQRIRWWWWQFRWWRRGIELVIKCERENS